MLDTLRRAAGTWISKLLLSLLIISFAIWGIAGRVVSGAASDSVVVAGGTKVSGKDYRLAYDRQVSILGQRFGQRITSEQARALGIDQQVLSQLVAGAVLDEQAREMKLGLSRDRLAALTAEDPAFRGADGRFSRPQFDAVLRQVGMRPEDYLLNRSQVAIRQQIVEAVSDGMKAPDIFLKAVALYNGEDRTVEYVVLPRSLVEPIAEPAPDVLAKWFEGRKETYAAPEYRQITYVKLEPVDIAAPDEVAEEAVRADYETNKAKFTTPETRTVEQLIFADEATANAALNSTKTGATFEDLVAAQGKTMDDVKVGAFAKEKMPDQKLADAIFALQPNQLSTVVAGSFGPVILRVTDIKPEVVKPYEEAKQQIRKDLALAEANRVLLEAQDQYEDARAGGATLAEAAAKLKLKVVTVEAVDRGGLRPDGTIVKDLPASEDLLKQAFETEAKTDSNPINVGSNGYLFYQVDKITPKHERALADVRDKVLADWKAEETSARIAAKAADLQKALKDGKSVDDVAKSVALDKQTKRGLKRGADDPDLGQAGVAAAFGVKEGETGTASTPAGDAQIVFKVTEVFEPVGASPETIGDTERKSYASAMSDDLLDQLIARLQSQYEVRVDQAAISRALAF